MKNVIFDIGNVLVDFHPIPYFQQLLPQSDMKHICSLVFDPIWEKIDQGEYTYMQAKEQHLQRHPQYQKEIGFIYDHWMSMMTLYEDTSAYLNDCKQHGYRIYLLSNIGWESYHYLKKRYSFFDEADGAVFSFAEHCLKPQAEIYKILLERYQLKPQECIYFDDRRANIQTALTLGIKGILFENCQKASQEAALW